MQVVIGMVGFIILTIASAFTFSRTRKKEQTPQTNTVEMKIATNNFSDNNILGKGGFGYVYKGMLENGQEIAVNRLKTLPTQGGKEFKNEAEPLLKLNHCNLVQLCGYTIEGIERLLIYELLTHGSLDKYIFGKFSWVTELTLIIIVVNLIIKRNLITFLLF
ncbi:putative protein kinase RLK-Pelle-DLSV family [Helianthus annuus]|nr:putative protein kinase RLK-Pelle-DLSV family [Helianthus annuus]